MENQIKSPKEIEVYETIKQQIEEEYKDEQKIKLKDILLKPFKMIKEFVQWVGDTIYMKTIPKEDRAEVLQKAIDENYIETKRLQEEQRKPDTKAQEIKKEILQNDELTMDQKIEALCELAFHSGKDITVALTKDINPDKTKAPDAILVFERQGDYVQIQYAPKELKTKNAKPSYNLTIKGGINYDEKGNATHKGLEETVRLFNIGLKPDLERIYIDKNSMLVETSQNFLQNDTEPITDKKNHAPIMEKAENSLETQMQENINQAIEDGKVVFPMDEQQLNVSSQDIINTASAAAAAYAGIEEQSDLEEIYKTLPSAGDEFEETQEIQLKEIQNNQELQGMDNLFPEEEFNEPAMESEEDIEINKIIFNKVLEGDVKGAQELVNKGNNKEEKNVKIMENNIER